MKSAVNIDRRWDVEIRKDVAEMIDEVQSAVRHEYDSYLWWQDVPWEECAAHVEPLWWDASIQRAQAFYAATAAEYAAHTRDMLPPAGWTVVADDKDKKMCWVMLHEEFQVAIMNYVTNNPMWALTSLTIEQASSQTFQSLVTRVPVRLHKLLRLYPSPRWLPHVYPTVKATCFLPARGREGLREGGPQLLQEGGQLRAMAGEV